MVPDGFVWQGATYGSLSTIARAITGTAWGGPRFFGLRGATSSQEDPEPDEATAKPKQARRVGASRKRPETGSARSRHEWHTKEARVS